MGKKSRPTFKKRQKELARKQKQQNKQAQRRAKTEQREGELPPKGDVDPDIEGIRPGPQPLPAEWHSLPEDDPTEDSPEDDS